MTEDIELLELAAKAAGIDLVEYSKQLEDDWIHFWNPLTDDGDALRLAVKLHITIDRGEVEPATWCYCDYQDRVSNGFVELHGNDPYAATRRAIVRTAAEIGRSM